MFVLCTTVYYLVTLVDLYKQNQLLTPIAMNSGTKLKHAFFTVENIHFKSHEIKPVSHTKFLWFEKIALKRRLVREKKLAINQGFCVFAISESFYIIYKISHGSCWIKKPCPLEVD